MLVDLDLGGRKVLVVGGGRESEFKVKKFLDSGARIAVAAPRFTKGIRSLADADSIELIPSRTAALAKVLVRRRPYIAIVSTGDAHLDEKLASAAKASGTLVCVVDTPRLNDFNVPAIAKVGGIRVAISTQGESPAIARLIRERIEKVVTPEDVLHAKLQGRVRRTIRRYIDDPRSRKRMVYTIIRSGKINHLLRERRFESARAAAEDMIRRYREPKSERRA